MSRGSIALFSNSDLRLLWFNAPGAGIAMVLSPLFDAVQHKTLDLTAGSAFYPDGPGSEGDHP
jgi:hypothetical protein